jgi:Aldo/keto reductase family
MLGLARFVCVQPRYNLLFREIERELLPLCGEEGVTVTPFNPLAGGLLTGKYRKAETPGEGRFSVANGAFGKIYQARYWQDCEFAAIGRIEAIARQRGTAMPRVAPSRPRRKPPGPPVGTLESRHSKNDMISIRYEEIRFCPWHHELLQRYPQLFVNHGDRRADDVAPRQSWPDRFCLRGRATFGCPFERFGWFACATDVTSNMAMEIDIGPDTIAAQRASLPWRSARWPAKAGR